MNVIPFLGTVFVAIAVIFLSIVVQDYLKAAGQMTPARKTWLRLALIFACVGIGLVALHMLYA